MKPNQQELFKLSSEQLMLTTKLAAIIRREIQASGGVMRFSRYMELALYTPELGYYANPSLKFGANGDFITAPLVSKLYAHALTRQINELFGFGLPKQLLEFGAGNGKLAADILERAGGQIDKYFILELSADLVLRQQETLKLQVPEQVEKVVWLSQLPTNFEGIIIANEVLDAQPCDLIQNCATGWSGLGVATDGESFCYQPYSLTGSVAELVAGLALPVLNYQTEIHQASIGFMNSLGQSLKRGAVLLLDYGYGESEYYHPQKTQGTLRGFYQQHLLEDVLIYPGLIDITSSVNWSAIATAGLSSGLELIGYTSQAVFLLNCGLLAELSAQHQHLDPANYLQLTNQANKLLSANAMGEVFKVMGFSKGLAEDSWLGFSHGDRSYSL